MYDVLRADRCISDNSIEARVPFGDLDFVRYVMAIDPALLRKAFEGDYLPHHILYREKAAFSDAVGHSLADDIKKYAEKRTTAVSGVVRGAVSRSGRDDKGFLDAKQAVGRMRRG